MDNVARECELCRGLIPAFTTAYSLRIQLFAEGGTVHITPDDLAQDHQKLMKELIAGAEKSDPQEMMDEVFESFTILLCAACRRNFHEHLNKFLKGRKERM